MSIDNKNININKNTITSLKYAGNMYNKGDKYKEEYMFYQICIENYNIFNTKELISVVALTNISSGNYELNDNIFRIFHVNLKNISKVCYTELDEANKFFKFISTDDIKELETLSKGDEILEKSADTIKQMSINRILISPEEKEKILEYSIRVGHMKDIEEARDEEKQEIARNMIKKGISLEDIIEITGLTKEEIEKL